jgi:hypothetical protein
MALARNGEDDMTPAAMVRMLELADKALERPERCWLSEVITCTTCAIRCGSGPADGVSRRAEPRRRAFFLTPRGPGVSQAEPGKRGGEDDSESAPGSRGRRWWCEFGAAADA